MNTATACPNCLKENSDAAHFCVGCGAPLTSHASIDPIGRIRAMGHVFGKATNRPASRTVLIGMWLIFGPLVIWNLVKIGRIGNAWLDSLSPVEVSQALRIDPQSGHVEVVEIPARRVRINQGPVVLLLVVLWLLAILAIQVAILWKVTRNYSRRPRPG